MGSLCDAAKYGSSDEVKRMLSEGADVNERDSDLQTPLHRALFRRFVHLIGDDEKPQDPDADPMIDCLINAGADVLATDEDGWTILHYAAEASRSDICRRALDMGADINVLTVRRDGSPLTAAARYADGSTIEFLISRGAPVNFATPEKCVTALHVAAMNRSPSAARVLIEHGADVRARDCDGWTPLHYVANPVVADLLIKSGAELNCLSADGSTPLHLARNVGVATILIEHGATLNATDANGLTPLHKAAFVLKYDLVQELLSKGANKYARTSDGSTPHDFAQWSLKSCPTSPGGRETVELLKQDQTRTWVTLCHLSGLIGFLGPLIVWQTQRHLSKAIDEAGKEALNFQITMAFIWLGVTIMSGALGGLAFLLYLALGVANLAFVISGAASAGSQKVYKYPFALRLIK